MAATDLENASTAAPESAKSNLASGSPNEKSDKSPVKGAQTTTHKDAMNHLVAGKRHLLVKDLEAAVESLGKASELLSAEYGETAYECADSYYYYGKALLEMARAEAGVFGNALDGVPDGEDSDNSQVEDPEKMTEDERETVEKQVGEALEENFSAMEEKLKKKNSDNGVADSTEGETEDEEGEEKEGEEKEGDGKEEEKEGEEEEKKADMETEDDKGGEKTGGGEEVKDTESVGGADAEEKEGEDQKEQEAEDEGDPSNLQLAWEMLELAKMAYSKKLESLDSVKEADTKKSIEAKLCETLLTLGEVSLEGENYDQAIADISDCLEKRKASLPSDSRRIAETLYHLGVALGLHNKFDEAVKSLEEAISVIKTRIGNLKEKKESADESKTGDAFYTREGEITELESLVPEIQEKIQDTKDAKSQQETNNKEEQGFGSGEKSTAKPISSIAIKRKAEGGDATSPKKPHVANGTTNGH